MMLRFLHKLFLLAILLSVSFGSGAQVMLSDSARVSLLTCSPSDEAVFTVYGHTAIRIFDADNKIDLVFNYGIFDFNGADFVWRFSKGETDYKLGVTRFDRFMVEYIMRGSGVTELILNFNHSEKQCLWEALYENAQPENAVYRYNFFFDNCATRPAAMIEKCAAGKVVYGFDRIDRGTAEEASFRDRINYSMRNQPWAIFGTELALGLPADLPITPREELFLPLYLEKALETSVIQSVGGEERPLVAQKIQLSENIPEDISRAILTPVLSGWLFFFLICLLSWAGWRKGRQMRWLDAILFLAYGLGGCVIFFLAFVSEHPATWPNWNILWLHPLYLAGIFSKGGRISRYWYIALLLPLAAFIFGRGFIPQTFNAAFLPLSLVMALRLLLRLYLSPRYGSQ
jgi:hypothetical protein